MEILLFIIILLQFGYIFYQDKLSREERNKMVLKVMSKNPEEYAKFVEVDTPAPEEDDEEEKAPEVVDLDEVSAEKLIKAKDES